MKTAAGAKRKSAPKDAKGGTGKKPYDVFSEKILASGKAMADAWGKAMQEMADEMNGSDTVEAEVVDDQESSGAANTNGTVVHQTIVNQYGDHPVHIDHVENLKL